MAMVKCSECGHEMSENAKMCPNCGLENSIKFCPECGKKLSSKANICPECGFQFNAVQTTNITNSSNGALGVIAFVFSFIIPFVGLIIGIIAYNHSKNTNSSEKTFSLAAIIISIVWLVLLVLFIAGMIIYSLSYTAY